MTSERERRAALAGAVLVALLGALVASPGAVASRKKLDYRDSPIPEWREGPARYIITKWEDDEYKVLRSEEERARFIESFWRRRDETPETPGNEFRARFWKRVGDANHLYGQETAKEGWRSDMGKMHILLGPPDDIYRDMVAEGHRGTVVWTYRSVGAPGVGPNAVVAFARDVTGEFRLSTEPTKDSDPKEGSPYLYQPPVGTGALGQAHRLQAQLRAEKYFNLTDPLIRQAGGPATAGPLALASELAKLQQPLKEWELRETITTQEFFGSVPMRARVDFFKTTGPHSLVLVTAAVRSSAVHYRAKGGREAPDISFYGRILDVTGNDLVLSLEDEGAFVPAPENATAGLDDDLVYQAAALLAPGAYKALLTVVDRAGGRAGSYQTSLTVPDFTPPGLAISSVVLARSIQEGPPEGASGGPPVQAYRLGGLRVVPRLGQTYRPAEGLSFYYQVYGAAEDPAGGGPSLDVDYGLYTVEAEQPHELGHVGFEAQRHAAHGYTLSLKDWPAGPYMLRVSVTDRIAGVTATRDVVFEVR